jgi:hypothetical protein
MQPQLTKAHSHVQGHMKNMSNQLITKYDNFVEVVRELAHLLLETNIPWKIHPQMFQLRQILQNTTAKQLKRTW